MNPAMLEAAVAAAQARDRVVLKAQTLQALRELLGDHEKRIATLELQLKALREKG